MDRIISIFRQELSKNVLTILLLVLVVAYCGSRFGFMEKGIDFPEFYSAAKMLLHGRAHELYNIEAQNRFQQVYTGRVGPYFNHPPFELLVYTPFCLFPIRQAYILWTILNAVLLFKIAILLHREAWPKLKWQMLLLICLIFVPILLTLIQGQDSILLLFLLCEAFAAMKNKAGLRAGGWLALGLFKFQIILPIALVLAFLGRRFLRGFLTTLTLLAAVSFAMAGWRVPVAYSDFLLKTSSIPLAGIYPQSMANLRGLSAQLVSSSSVTLIATLALSLFVVVIVIYDTMRASGESIYKMPLLVAESILAALLVSFHLSPHDLALLALPLYVISNFVFSLDLPKRQQVGYVAAVTAGVLPPIHLFLLAKHVYTFMGLFVVALFALSHFLVRAGQRPLR